MNKKDTKRKYTIKGLLIVFLIICLSVFIYSAYNIVTWFIENKENKNIQEELKEFIQEEPKVSNEKAKQEEVKYVVDFASLKEKNSDTVAYLKVNNTNIDYVVVKGSDNSYYLTHNLNKKYNKSGWIFADYRDKFDGNDKNVIIYGHNTKDGSMFGTLRRVVEEEWYNNEDNLLIPLVTENETVYYRVFSVYKVDKEDYYIQTEFESDTAYKNFLSKIKSRSVKNFNVSLDENDRILTLSTCTAGGKRRVVLHAKRVDEKINENQDNN